MPKNCLKIILSKDVLTHATIRNLIKQLYMTNEQKGQVRDALVRYVNNFDSQTKAAESLQGISSSTISQVKNHNWELLSNRLWYHIARQVGFYCGEWQPADTNHLFAVAYSFQRCPALLHDVWHFHRERAG